MTVTFLNVCKLGPPDRRQALFHGIIQRLIINNDQLFNILQQEYYLVTDELTYAKNILINTIADSHESPTTFSCCNIISHQW